MVKEEVKVCPKCGKQYTGYPALSRRDNETRICPQCGVDEAMEDFFGIFEKKGKDEDDGSDF